MNIRKLVKKADSFKEKLSLSDLEILVKDLELCDFDESTIDLDNSNYLRKVLFKSEILEIALIHWKDKGRSSIHCHGISNCVFKVLSGQLLEKRVSDSAVLNVGDVSCIQNSDVHQVFNLNDFDSTSLHLYSPPIIKEIYNDK